jgi:outer membrane protein OmpA-like peptidoglycan-associated protein
MAVCARTESRDQSAAGETRQVPSGRGHAAGRAGLAAAIGNRAFASLYGRALADPSAALAPAIGNRAFAALQRPALQRCGCRGACGCRGPSTTTVGPCAPALGSESDFDAIWWRALARRGMPGVDCSGPVAPVAGRPRRTLQRSSFPPLARPFPPWSTKDPAQPAGDCVPFIDTNDAMIAWLIVKAGFHKAINDMCRDCPAQALEVYDAYMDAGGTPRFTYNEARDGLTCQIRSLKGDPDHEPAEQPVINAVRGNLPSLIPRLAGVPSVTLSLVDAGVPRTLIHPNPAVGCTRRNANDEPACLFLGSNQTFGSFLFGKGHESGSIVDSEYGNDTRDVDGTVELIKVGAPTDPTIQVRLVFRFEWSLVDAVDFCPGNTMSFNRLAHALLGTASELEATGMARDIFVSAQYTRIRDQLPPAGPFPNPDVPPPPAPRVVRLPAEALFDFDKDQLRPGAATTLITFLGTRPTRQDPGRRVQVRGHTDSKGSAVYNQGLSERRARTVADLLERQYPNLVGRIDAVGFGATQPVAPNSNPDGSDNPSGRAANRRVDIEFDIDEP